LAFLVSATVCFFNLRSVIVESFRRFFFALLLQVLLLNALFALIASGGVGSGRFEEVGVNLVSLLIWSALYTVLGLIGALVLISRMRGQESVEK
jgi:hypothetical protein